MSSDEAKVDELIPSAKKKIREALKKEKQDNNN